MISEERRRRLALEACQVRLAGGEVVQRRVLTDRADLRAGEPGSEDARLVRGVAIRFGDEARLGKDMVERIAAGALKLPDGPANLNMQHDRSQPLGLLDWDSDADEIRFSCRMPGGMRQDQALDDVRSGLLRGASIEFVIEDERMIEQPGKPTIFEVLQGRLLRVALVDDGAYPQSSIAMGPEPGDAPAARRRPGEVDLMPTVWL